MSSLRYAPAILVGRIVRVLARWRKPGGGSAIPGVVVNRIAPGFLAATLNGFPRGLVIVTGSSGKSTTTKMLVAILRAHGLSVFTNQSTANISQGLTSALLEQVSLAGTFADDVAVLEMDEGHGAFIARSLTPRVVALTNVMVDQIDRFHDSEMVAALLEKIAARATESVVLNADDRYLADLGSALKPGIAVSRYGVTAEVLAEYPRGLGYADTAPTRLPAGSGLQLTRVVGRDADVQFATGIHSIRLPARGIHYAVDALTALSTASVTLGERFSPEMACAALSALPAVFGRGEVVTVGGKTIEFVLVQNPSSFQLNVDSLVPGTEQILVIIGSDVRDPSYFWPVDTSGLGHVLMASGLKAHEIALQLAYDDVAVDRIEPDVPTALDAFLALPDPASGVKTIIFSADGMRRTRAHLGLVSNSEDPV
ncbi:Mur ligase family protein [Cryobacterium serini]|uniref:DUF1727 domain-containing protein n=1 Tax=Cryobacterium serini TaxID=1259201 RepID=A0A4R9BR66_9MICO|nr:MurT ligase domain-containing protein [Cryobacterium serini]TFD89241.1 DUF1727 domain-containing protein [Cryobacterium serini]